MKSLILSPKILSLISEFALTLYRSNQKLIDVESDNILSIMHKQAKATQNRQLILIYLHIRAELSISLEKNLCNGHTVPRNQMHTVNRQAVHH